MGKYKGVVFFDYDYTTIDESNQIMTATKKTVQSLEKLKKNGYLTLLCSGRSKRFLENDSNKFQGVITCNGSYTEVEGQVISDIHISEELVQELIHKYFCDDMALHLETQNVTYYLDENQEFYKKFRAFLDFPDEWFAPWNKRKDEHITKIVLNYEDEKIVEKFLEEYSDKLQCVKPFVGRGILDVTSKGVTKGEAIRRLLSYFDIDVRDSYAFGDSDNDVEMLRAVGTGIVMEHHSKAAGEAATMVTGAVKDEGITQALEKLGLI